VSFMVHKMAKNQKNLFQSFCDTKGFNYAPAITFLLEFYETFKKEKKKDEVLK